jgi:hypothetical protein
MSQFTEKIHSSIGQSPLVRLLQGVHASVFDKEPRSIATRQLARNMSEELTKLSEQNEWAVLTNRGVPRFLLVPIDAGSWMQLLFATTPEFEAEAELGEKSHPTFAELSSEPHA